MTCSPQQQDIVVAHLTVTEVKLVFSHIACSSEAIWEDRGKQKRHRFRCLFLFGSFLSSQVHHRPGCLSYGKSKGFPFYNDLQPAETILCFRAKYFGVCELTFRVGMGATTISQLNRNPNGFPINGSPAFSKVSS